MALADRLANANTTKGGTPCSMCEVLDKLEESDREALLVALGTPERRGRPAGAIFDALKAEGHTVAFRTINHHRAGKCRGAK